MVAVPLPVASALLMGGTSLAGESATVKVVVLVVPAVGAVGESSEHAPVRTLRPTMSNASRFMLCLPF
jgi:hypothetical protein